jgi:hypothetical protein
MERHVEAGRNKCIIEAIFGYKPAWQRQEEQGATKQSTSAMQLAQEEPEPIDKAALLAAFVEAMNANIAQSSNSSQAET